MHHRLSLVCVNDVYSFDDVDTTGSPRGGWARASTLIKSLRDNSTPENQTVLVSANGDVLGGSSLLQHSEGRVAVDVMNSIPVDLAVLGNHEFDYGDEVLMKRLMDSSCVWLGSNIYYPEPGSDFKPEVSSLPDGHGYFPGVNGEGMIYTLRDNLKLGVFGLVTKQTPKISYPSPKVVFDADVISVARRTSAFLRSRGAQIIVAITHMSEAEDRLLASDKLAGVDLVMGGHEHEPVSVMVHCGEGDEDDDAAAGHRHNEGGVLVFKCGMNAYWVGSVDLDIEYECVHDNSHSEKVKVTSISTSWGMHTVSSQTPEDPVVSKIVQRFRRDIDESMLCKSFGEEIAGTLKLDDVIAKIGSTDNSNNSTVLPLDTRMSSVRRKEATGTNLVADAMLWLLETNIQTHEDSSLPKLAMINGGFIRADRLYQPGSDFTVRHLLKELPFPRGMVVLKLKGRFLRAAICQQLKGSSRGPTGAYPHLSHNARMVYELSSDDSDEEIFTIETLKVDGVEVSDDQQFLIAVTGFVADGSEGCTEWLQSTRIRNPAWDIILMSCVLLKYLLQHPVITPQLEGRVVKSCQPTS
jgi:5'-nucleotidase/UDP-sugar diphosphatase